ncbi:hypothetical protein D3C87_616390 [compost metagenome]
MRLALCGSLDSTIVAIMLSLGRDTERWDPMVEVIKDLALDNEPIDRQLALQNQKARFGHHIVSRQGARLRGHTGRIRRACARSQ